MTDKEKAAEGQLTDHEKWATGGVLSDPLQEPSIGMECADTAASDSQSQSGSSEHLRLTGDGSGCGDGGTESHDEADSSSTDTDDEPLSKIAKMRKVASGSPGAKSPKKQRRATGPRAPTAYKLFVRENQLAIKSEHSSARPAEVQRILRGLWKNMDIKARKPYTDASKIAKMEHKAQVAAMQHENANNITGEQGAVPEKDVHVTAVLGQPLSAPMILTPAGAMTDSVPVAKPSTSRLSSADSAPRFTPAVPFTPGVVGQGIVTAVTPVRNADSLFPATHVLSLLRASPLAAAGGVSAAMTGRLSNLPAASASPSGSAVAISAGRAENSGFAVSSASAHPHQVHTVPISQTVSAPVGAIQPLRTTLHSAISGQRGTAVMANGRTNIVTVTQQNNGLSNRTPHTIRLIALGSQTTLPRPNADPCSSNEARPTDQGTVTFQQQDLTHPAVQKSTVGLDTPATQAALAASGSSGAPSVPAGSLVNALVPGGTPESLAADHAGQHPQTSSIAHPAATGSTPTEYGLLPMDSDCTIADHLLNEHSERDIEMAEVIDSVDAVRSRAQTLLKSCRGCGRTIRNQISEDGDKSQPLREQSKKLVQWSHENYCTSQCTVNHCRSVFDNWVASRRQILK